MNKIPYISICIPAYKRLDYLKRLLDSIEIQDFINYEVVITDDSGDDSTIQDYINQTTFNFSLNYIKNNQPLGSPQNWLESFKYAKGEWIKIMHDDDTFSVSTALSSFVSAIDEDVDVVFSGFSIKNESDGIVLNKTMSSRVFNNIKKRPLRLFASNVFGHPSVMLFNKSISEQFDPRLKWIVDWEFYIRMIINYKVKYIAQPLVLISQNESQITNSCFRNPNIELPEILIFYEKFGDVTFKDIVVFDAWWRLIRNLKIRSIKEIESYTKDKFIPFQLRKIIAFQSLVPHSLLSFGVFSKLFMAVAFVINSFTNNRRLSN